MSQKRAVVLYLFMHQPMRLSPYSIFDASVRHEYFDAPAKDEYSSNKVILDKVAHKSYLPTLKLFEKLHHKHPDFKFSLSLSGTIIEQLEQWQPEVLSLIRRLVHDGSCEIVGEAYHHSLSFFYSRNEFEEQVALHKRKMQELFNVTPTAFRNTEMSYNNDIAYWADKAGYKVILSEGWDPILKWRSPNYVYRPAYTENIKLLTKNYRLSDDIAFRFGNKAWAEWPLTAKKYVTWLNSTAHEPLINLFMDFETFGEHQWADKGIFEFMDQFVVEWLKDDNHKFMQITEATDVFESVDFVDCPETITWADNERDLTAWTGNAMQAEAIKALYELEQDIKSKSDKSLLNDWRKLQTSDHFYYMCTKWFTDGDVHAYFSPYNSPYDAYINFMNVYHDLRYRIMKNSE